MCGAREEQATLVPQDTYMAALERMLQIQNVHFAFAFFFLFYLPPPLPPYGTLWCHGTELAHSANS